MNLLTAFGMGITSLVFLAIGFVLGRRFGREDGDSAAEVVKRQLEDSLRSAQTQLALAKQSETQQRELKDAQVQENVSLRSQIEEHLEKDRRQGADLQTALSKAADRDEQFLGMQSERNDLRKQLDEAHKQIQKQGEAIGEAGRTKANLEEQTKVLESKEYELGQLRSDLTELRTQIAELNTSALKDQEALANERRQIQENQKVLRQEFENLANQIFESKSNQFNTQSQLGLTSLLAPLKEQLDSFRLRVDQVHTENVQGHTSLKGELDKLRELNQQVTQEATNLTRALKGDKKIQGTWGEEKVELILEQAGLQKDIEYSREKNYKDEDGNNLRPDFVVNLPEGKHIIIDSKVSLVSYSAYVGAESPEERQVHLAAHIAALKNHIRSLSDKNYPNLEGMKSPDFTFLFIAIEPAYLVAAEHSPALFQEAYEKRIAIVTATTLFPVLRVVSNLWTIQKQNQFTKQLADQAGKVHDKLVVFISKMVKLGNQIETAQKTYKDSFDSLKDGRGSLVKTVERFSELGAKVSKKLPALSIGASAHDDAGEHPDLEIEEVSTEESEG